VQLKFEGSAAHESQRRISWWHDAVLQFLNDFVGALHLSHWPMTLAFSEKSTAMRSSKT
jgi:hypothetical protein